MEIGFGKVIPIRVYADNREVNDTKVIKKAVRQLTIILHGRNTKNPDAKQFKAIFKDHVPDYTPPSGTVEYKEPTIRNLINDTYRFLFTGQEVKALNPLGKLIGKAKGEGKSLYGSTRTIDSREKTKEFFKLAYSFIKEPHRRLKSEAELRIYTTGKKFDLQDIMFKTRNEPKHLPKEQLMLFDDSNLNKTRATPDSLAPQRGNFMHKARKTRSK